MFLRFKPEIVVHFAAESHVDRSILGPEAFVQTNVTGTFRLLEAARALWGSERGLFHHVSTDEVYGSLGSTGAFTEESPYDPSSPYAATKAASDHLVRAYRRTYGLRTKVTNCSNNYGPYQFPEKLIPLMILKLLAKEELPIYGAGENVRDWLFVEDHCEAIWAVIERGEIGETYNIGGWGERRNIEIVDRLCALVAEETGGSVEELLALKRFVTDRPGHDFRYAIDPTKLQQELGWKPTRSLEEGLRATVRWYLSNPEWVKSVRTGAYREWIEANYGQREGQREGQPEEGAR